jgi:hypothetical protein
MRRAFIGRQDRAGYLNSGERMLAGGGVVGRPNFGEAAVVGGDSLYGVLPPAAGSSPQEHKKLHYFSSYSVFLTLLYSKIYERRNAK